MPPLPPRPESLPAPTTPAAGNGAGADRLGLNLFDVADRVDPTLYRRLLRGRLDPAAGAVAVGDKPDGRALPFRCGLLEAAKAVDLVRSEDRKAGRAPTRAYLCRGRAWSPLPGDAVLTRVVAGRAVLDPVWFPRPAAPYAAPAARVCPLGRPGGVSRPAG